MRVDNGTKEHMQNIKTRYTSSIIPAVRGWGTGLYPFLPIYYNLLNMRAQFYKFQNFLLVVAPSKKIFFVSHLVFMICRYVQFWNSQFIQFLRKLFFNKVIQNYPDSSFFSFARIRSIASYGPKQNVC